MTNIYIKTNYGEMFAELYPEQAPKTVESFLGYVRRGFYDNTLVHRVIRNFMIQGGGLEVGMYLKTTEPPIENEAANGLKNEKYSLAMARTPAPDSATSQFFINVADNASLDFTEPTESGFGYCVFGRLTEGADVALKISEATTGERAGYQDVPVQDVIIETITEMSADESGSDESGSAESGNAEQPPAD